MLAATARDGWLLSAARPWPGLCLDAAPLGFRGRVRAIEAAGRQGAELERGLAARGVTEGARIEVAWLGEAADDPLAVRLDGRTLVLDHCAARAILVEPLD